jgi:hypothetical protein
MLCRLPGSFLCLKNKTIFAKAFMKKLLVIFFTLVYLGFSSGLVLEIHHCMGAVADFSLVKHSYESTCGKCGMKKGENGCCKDEVKFVKLQDSHKLVHADYSLPVPIALISIFHQLFYQDIHNLAVTDEYNIHSPPMLAGVSQHIKNCVFRI